MLKCSRFFYCQRTFGGTQMISRYLVEGLRMILQFTFGYACVSEPGNMLNLHHYTKPEWQPAGWNVDMNRQYIEFVTSSYQIPDSTKNKYNLFLDQSCPSLSIGIYAVFIHSCHQNPAPSTDSLLDSFELNCILERESMYTWKSPRGSSKTRQPVSSCKLTDE